MLLLQIDSEVQPPGSSQAHEVDQGSYGPRSRLAKALCAALLRELQGPGSRKAKYSVLSRPITSTPGATSRWGCWGQSSCSSDVQGECSP